MATLQLPEGYTVRKVGNSLKVVPQRKRKVAIEKEKQMQFSLDLFEKVAVEVFQLHEMTVSLRFDEDLKQWIFATAQWVTVDADKATAIKKALQRAGYIQEVAAKLRSGKEDSYEDQVRRHDERMAAVYAQRAAEEAAKEMQYADAIANPPTLRGSAKQIEWASKIRGAYIEFYKDRRREWMAQEVIEHTDAHHWIENRYGMGVTNADQRAIQALIYAK